MTEALGTNRSPLLSLNGETSEVAGRVSAIEMLGCESRLVIWNFEGWCEFRLGTSLGLEVMRPENSSSLDRTNCGGFFSCMFGLDVYL